MYEVSDPSGGSPSTYSSVRPWHESLTVISRRDLKLKVMLFVTSNEMAAPLSGLAVVHNRSMVPSRAVYVPPSLREVRRGRPSSKAT
eukprot:scaffold22545_cov126-Isochrysis_galbana.AAC.14